MRRAARKERANQIKRGNRESGRAKRAASAGKDPKPVGKPAGNPPVTLPPRGLPDWLVRRWAKRVCAFFRRQRRMCGIPLDALRPVSGMTREGWRKFEKGSKCGPLFATIRRSPDLRQGWLPC